MRTWQMWAFKNKKTGKLFGETKKELPAMCPTKKEAKAYVLPDEQVVRVQVTIEELE